MTNENMLIAALASLAALGVAADASGQALPNPYRLVDGWAKLPGGREIGAVGDVDIDVDGRHVWAVLRCDAGGDKFGYECLDSDLDVVVKFAPDGNAVATFGGGLFIWPHGLEMVKVDVDEDPALAAAYGHEVPVLCLGTRRVVSGRVSARALRALLARQLPIATSNQRRRVTTPADPGQARSTRSYCRGNRHLIR